MTSNAAVSRLTSTRNVPFESATEAEVSFRPQRGARGCGLSAIAAELTNCADAAQQTPAIASAQARFVFLSEPLLLTGGGYALKRDRTRRRALSADDAEAHLDAV